MRASSALYPPVPLQCKTTPPRLVRRSVTPQATSEDGPARVRRAHSGQVDDEMVCLMRLVLAVSALVIVYLDPAEPNRLVPVTYTALVLYTLYSAALYVLTLRRESWQPGRWVPWADIASFL